MAVFQSGEGVLMACIQSGWHLDKTKRHMLEGVKVGQDRYQVSPIFYCVLPNTTVSVAMTIAIPMG